MTLVTSAQDAPNIGPKGQVSLPATFKQLPVAFDHLPYDQISVLVSLEVYQNPGKEMA